MDKKDKLKEVVDQAIASQHVPHVKLKKMGPTSVDIDKLTKPSKETHQEYWGKGLTYLAIVLIIELSQLSALSAITAWLLLSAIMLMSFTF